MMVRETGYDEAYELAGINPENYGDDNSSVDAIDAVDTVPKELPDAPKFPMDAMPDGCRKLIREAAKAIGCPPSSSRCRCWRFSARP